MGINKKEIIHLINAIFNMGADDEIIENIEQASQVAESIERATLKGYLTEEDDIIQARALLGLSNRDVKRIFRWIDGSTHYLCYFEEWESADYIK